MSAGDTSGVKALNREFERYDQVRKTHTYRLAESETDEFDEDYRIAAQKVYRSEASPSHLVLPVCGAACR